MLQSFQAIDQKLANREPVYIRNKSRHPASGALSIVVVSYPSAEGEKSFNVPRSTMPFNICNYVDPESLRVSTGFRKLLNNGALEVVEEDEAQKAAQDPAAVEAFQVAYMEATNTYAFRADEQRKNQQAEAEIKAEKQREQSGGMKNMLAAMDPKLAQALNIIGTDGQRPDPKLITTRSPRFTALEARVRNKTVGDVQIINELSGMLSDLTIDDLSTVAAGGIWPHIAAMWARERLEFKSRQV